MGLVDLRYQKTKRNREQLLRHLETFELELKLSVGVWYFSPMASRFHDRYGTELSIEERLRAVAQTARYGVRGVEAHYPSEVNEDNIHLYKQLEQETEIRLFNAGPFIFYDKSFEFGSLSNPISKNRDRAVKILVDNLKFVKEFGLDHCGVWPGIDGYTYSLGMPFDSMWSAFEEGVAEAMDTVPGVRVAIEPKPYEPIPNNIYRTTADGVIAARDIESMLTNDQNKALLSAGHALVALQPEVGHINMGYEDPAYVYSRVAREGRLAHVHLNSQPAGNYDQDLNVGVVGWEQMEATLYALKTAGYKGYLGLDINPERMPAIKAVEVNARVLNIMNQRINSLPHERVLACYFEPEENRGELELILAEARGR